MRCHTRRWIVNPNPYMNATWWITREVRTQANPAYRSYQRRRMRILQNRRNRAGIDQYAPDISFAAYLALDWDGTERKKWQANLIKDAARLRGIQAQQGVPNPQSVATAAESIVKLGRAPITTQDYQYITNLRTGVSLRALAGSPTPRRDWERLRNHLDPLATTYTTILDSPDREKK